jgi:hypothetical protein
MNRNYYHKAKEYHANTTSCLKPITYRFIVDNTSCPLLPTKFLPELMLFVFLLG